jgi:hypothetical protein
MPGSVESAEKQTQLSRSFHRPLGNFAKGGEIPHSHNANDGFLSPNQIQTPSFRIGLPGSVKLAEGWAILDDQSGPERVAKRKYAETMDDWLRASNGLGRTLHANSGPV